MAIPAQSPGPAPTAGHPWPAPEQFQALAPLVRLLSEIGAIPLVTKIGITIGETRAALWVFMSEEDYDAEAMISRAERSYLIATRNPLLDLHVLPGSDVSPNMLPPYTVIFER